MMPVGRRLTQFGFGLLALTIAVLITVRFATKSRSHDKEYRAKLVQAVVTQLANLGGGPSDSPLYGSLLTSLSWNSNDRHVKSWRVFVAGSIDTLKSPEEGDVYTLFCLQKSPPNQRIVRLMAITGVDSAYERMRTSNWRSICSVAPDTIIVIEVTGAKVNWTDPGDLDPDVVPHVIHPKNELGIGANFPQDGFLVGFLDGVVWALDESTPYGDVAKFFTVEGAVANDREKVLRPHVKLELLSLMPDVSRVLKTP